MREFKKDKIKRERKRELYTITCANQRKKRRKKKQNLLKENRIYSIRFVYTHVMCTSALLLK